MCVWVSPFSFYESWLCILSTPLLTTVHLSQPPQLLHKPLQHTALKCQTANNYTLKILRNYEQSDKMTYSLEWFQSESIYLNKTDYAVTYILNALPTLHPSQPYFDCRSIFYSITSASKNI